MINSNKSEEKGTEEEKAWTKACRLIHKLDSNEQYKKAIEGQKEIAGIMKSIGEMCKSERNATDSDKIKRQIQKLTTNSPLILSHMKTTEKELQKLKGQNANEQFRHKFADLATNLCSKILPEGHFKNAVIEFLQTKKDQMLWPSDLAQFLLAKMGVVRANNANEKNAWHFAPRRMRRADTRSAEEIKKEEREKEEIKKEEREKEEIKKEEREKEEIKKEEREKEEIEKEEREKEEIKKEEREKEEREKEEREKEKIENSMPQHIICGCLMILTVILIIVGFVFLKGGHN
ncbi:hypothetical protein niasHT_027798 [Heterodera trifolii]|uniref:Uncharacterized protein n=1 Tax=Heterodera trifolii TaxID=157864 RepID=A0ABD2JFN4_9BILA